MSFFNKKKFYVLLKFKAKSFFFVKSPKIFQKKKNNFPQFATRLIMKIFEMKINKDQISNYY